MDDEKVLKEIHKLRQEIKEDSARAWNWNLFIALISISLVLLTLSMSFWLGKYYAYFWDYLFATIIVIIASVILLWLKRPKRR